MALFDLSRFRDLAFKGAEAPDHPIEDEKAARKVLDALPVGDPAAALAELTHWAASMNATDSFTPGRRARVLMVLDDAARAYWRELGEQFLAPAGTPAEGRDGDLAILRALFESAAEFANGYALCRLPGGKGSRWVEANYVRAALRNMRWLARRLTLANMLHLPESASLWESVHRLYLEAEEHEVERKPLPVFDGDPFASSVKQEYVRVLLVEIASPATLRGREVELVFRIAGRNAAAAQLEREPLAGAVYALVPSGNARPVSVKRLGKARDKALWLDTTNCLPRLRAALERDMGRDESEADTLYGSEYTLRERNRMLRRLEEAWGPNPPKRRAQRVRLASTVRVLSGFDAIATVIPVVDQGAWTGGGAEAGAELRIQLDDTEQAAERGKRAVVRQNPARLLDASSGGMGIAISRAEAKWAQLGALLGACMDPGHDWGVGVLRRVLAEGEELRLGIQMLALKPKLVWFRLENVSRASPWDEHLVSERNFLQHFQRGILLDMAGNRIEAGELLVAPGVASRGSQLDIPLAAGVQRIRVTATREATEAFHRLAFETLALAPYTGKRR